MHATQVLAHAGTKLYLSTHDKLLADLPKANCDFVKPIKAKVNDLGGGVLGLGYWLAPTIIAIGLVLLIFTNKKNHQSALTSWIVRILVILLVLSLLPSLYAIFGPNSNC